MNNAAVNLRWATKHENEHDKEVHGTRRRGTSVRSARLTEGIVAELKRRMQIGRVSMKAFAKEFGVPVGPVNHAMHGRSWKHVTVHAISP